MGNYRFRLSDMIPNAWFYKLKDMGAKPKPHAAKKPPFHLPSSPPLPSPRQSYYFSSDSREKLFISPLNPKVSDTHFPDPPRKSRKRSQRKKRSVKPSSPSAGCGCRATIDSVWTPTESPASSCGCRAADLGAATEAKKDFSPDLRPLQTGFESASELELPPILTKPKKVERGTEHRKKVHSGGKPMEKKVVSSPDSLSSINVAKEAKPSSRNPPPLPPQGLRIRTNANSPRLASKKLQAFTRRGVSAGRRKSVSESFAVVKSSFDPQRDFRDSMVEMIVENNLRASKDLEELLACYLSLNSDEYHDVIVKVFEQIWFDLTDIRL